MMNQQIVHLARDVEAILVPYGDLITIPEGTFVTVMQTLGGSFTVVVNGHMARIDGAHADALGLETETIEYAQPTDDKVNEEDLWRTMQTVYDPEIPVNIADLGLIYDCKVEKTDANKNKVHVDMTLTAPGCGMGPVLVEEVRYRLTKVPNVDEVQVDLVFDPPWGREMMTEVGSDGR